MQVTISGHHIELTQAIKDHTEEKCSKLHRHFNEVDRMNVILSVDKNQQKAEGKLHFLGQDFFADAYTDDLYKSIDAMVDKLDKQLNKQRQKVKKARPV